MESAKGKTFDFLSGRRSLVDLTLSSSSSSSSISMSVACAEVESTEVWTWGSGKYGRLALGNCLDASVPAAVSALAGRSVRSASAGSFVTAFLVDSGQLYMSGKDINGLFAGALLPEANEDSLVPVAIPFFAKITLVQVAVGETMCCALDDVGQLYWWGANHSSAVMKQPTLKFRLVACGGSHALAIGVDGLCYAWGANEARQLSLALPGEFCSLPTVVRLPAETTSRVDHIACGFSSSAILLSDGTILAAGTVVGQSPFKVVNFALKGETIRKVFCTDSYICVTTLLGEAYLLNSVPLPFSSETDRVARVFGDLSVRDLVCGSEFLSCLTDSGSIQSWGRCCLQLGLGEVRAKKHTVGPRVVGSFAARFVRSVSCGTAHVVACLAPQGGAREAVGWELLETERVFYRSLVIINEVFRPMAKPRSQLAKLCSEVEAMLRPHAEILVILLNKMESWSDASVLGPLFHRIAKKSSIEVFTKFHRLLADWSKEASKFLPGGKLFQEHEELAAKGAQLRKTDSPYERKKPINLVGLLNEPFERVRQYSWLCNRLLAATPSYHADFKELSSAAESFQRELSGFYSEVDLMKMTVARLEQDKEELKQRLVSLSAANDGLHLARNNHELQKRELSEVNERHEHKLRTLSREADALRERNLQAFLETRQEIIRRRRAESAAQRATEEAAIMKGEAKRLETELSVARSMKLFRDVAELRSALTERDKQLYLLREELQKTKEAQLMQSYTDAHIRSVESENTRLSKQIQTLREELLEAVRLRHAPILETIGVAVGENKDELLLATDGSVRGSSVQGLVNALVRLQGGKEITEAYMRSFFLTYRVFITPIELQYVLQELYCNTSLFPDLEPPVVWSRVLGVFRHWITEYAEDFTARGMQALLWSFLEETVCVTLSPATADAIMKDFHRQTAGDEKLTKELEQQRSTLAGGEVDSIPVDETVVVSGSAQQIMEQLVQIEFELLCGVEAKELLGCQWLKPDKELRSPAIVAVTKRFNRVCSWAVTEILSRSDPKDRRDVLVVLISCASRARAQGAINCTMELVAALNNGAVQRLKKTWDLVSRKDKQTFEELEEFVSSKGSYKLMREFIKERREKGLCVLPYVGMFLGDLVYTDEGSMAELSPGVINFVRLNAISSIIREVLSFRSPPFVAPVIPKLRSYLISCAVLSEDDAWLRSAQIEPRTPESGNN